MNTKRFLELVGSDICTEPLREIELADGVTTAWEGSSFNVATNEKPFICLSFSLTLTRSASTHENIQEIIFGSSTKNEVKKIMGMIKFYLPKGVRLLVITP